MNATVSLFALIAVLLVAELGFSNARAHAEARSIDSQEAVSIALKHMPGSLLKVEREYELGILYFEVEIRAETGMVYEVNVAADDGRILSVELD